MSPEIGVDARFALEYFGLPVSAISHHERLSKGGLTLYIIKNTDRKVWTKCRRRWTNKEVSNRELEYCISKICRMVCHNTADKTIRILTGVIFK